MAVGTETRCEGWEGVRLVPVVLEIGCWTRRSEIGIGHKKELAVMPVDQA